LINFVLSYSPLGAVTITLAPTMVCLRAFANARAPIAGLPARLIESLRRESANPERVIARASSPTVPVMSPHE
jgi:hypothetical protein